MTTTERDQFEHARGNAQGWLESIEEMLAELHKATETEDGEENQPKVEEVEQRIHESVLSIMVRDAWRSPGQQAEDGPEEYEILLTTGGPSLRIYGRLGAHSEPETAELQMQDWGTPWTRYPASKDTLLKFASCFYFGE